MRLEYSREKIICHVTDQEILELQENLKPHLEIKEISDTDLRRFVLIIDTPPTKRPPTKFERAMRPVFGEPSGPASLSDSEDEESKAGTDGSEENPRVGNSR